MPILSAFPGFCPLLELGVPFVVLNYIYLSSMQMHTVFYFNYINYSGLLIFCCQSVANNIVINFYKIHILKIFKTNKLAFFNSVYSLINKKYEIFYNSSITLNLIYTNTSRKPKVYS